MPCHVREPEDVFSARTQLLCLFKHVPLLSLGKHGVFISLHRGPCAGVGRLALCFIVLFLTGTHSPLCALHQTHLSSCLLYLLQGN